MFSGLLSLRQYTEHHLRYTRLNRTFLLFIVTAAVALLLSLSSKVQDWEEDLGLSWLFQARGVTTPPSSVAVISIDQSSSRHFNLPNLARKWPRTLHAKLLQRLHKAGARAVLFDIHFRAKRPGDQDALLAKAISDAGNVVLFSFLQKEVIEVTDQQGQVSQLILDELVPPQDLFAQAAIALAPNPLPKVPIKVSQFWKFVPEAGDAPTLPSLAFQLQQISHLSRFINIVAQESKAESSLVDFSEQDIWSRQQLVPLMKVLREQFINQPALHDRVSSRITRSDMSVEQQLSLRNLLQFYTANAAQYLSYYGPAKTIKTYPYYQVLESDLVLEQLRDKVVFIGFSEHRQWEQQDGFYSVYSNEEGLDISGVEITASAAANLIDGISVKPMMLGVQMLIMLLLTLLMVLIFRFTRGALLPILLIVLGIGYFIIAATLFAQQGIWLPVFIPLLVQLPLVLVLGMVWNYQEINVERKNIQRAFGFYLPENEINRLAHDIADHGLGGQLMHGICLSTDAQQYTTLSEKFEPQQLSTFMNEYYEAIFKPVRDHGGIISDVVGDSVMALWASPGEDQQHRHEAVDACVAIMKSIKHFNEKHSDNPLPTRIGMHYGAMVLGNVGAVDHYEYRAVGDIVNTTSRIEGMSKYLGTRLLVSAEVLEGLDDVVSRCVGRFTLKGKTVPVELFEVKYSDDESQTDWEKFANALDIFQQGQWQQACDAFSEILKTNSDGPSQFYIDYCKTNQCNPPENWQGVINMEDK